MYVKTNTSINYEYRYQFEKYRGRGTRYSCPQCGRKYCFTRYIDTETNQYINERVGTCNSLDKCGYHYTPREYFSDNPWLRDKDFYIHTIHRGLYVCKIENPQPDKLTGRLPRWSSRKRHARSKVKSER